MSPAPGVVMNLVFALQLGTISAMFPAHVRYAGMAIAWNVGTAALA